MLDHRAACRSYASIILNLLNIMDVQISCRIGNAMFDSSIILNVLNIDDQASR